MRSHFKGGTISRMYSKGLTAVLVFALIFTFSVPSVHAAEGWVDRLLEVLSSFGLDGETFTRVQTAIEENQQSQLAAAGVLDGCLRLKRNLWKGRKDRPNDKDVTRLQRFLRKEGHFYHPISGKYQLTTQRAVQRWQRANKIVTSGTPSTTEYGAIGKKSRAFLDRKCKQASSKSTNTNKKTPTKPTTSTGGTSSGGTTNRNITTTQPKKSSVEASPKEYKLRTVKNVVYTTSPKGKKLRLDLYLPRTQEKLPAIVFVHGGGWSTGWKGYGRDLFQAVAERGYVVASIQYHFSQDALWPAQIYDVSAAVRWLRANSNKYNIDRQNIGAMGESAGGHLVSILGVLPNAPEINRGGRGHQNRSSAVKAVVNLYGPTNLTRYEDFSPSSAKLISDLIGCSDLSDQPCASRHWWASPSTYVEGPNAAFLHIHGTGDTIVPYDQSARFHRALKAKGTDSTLITVENGWHHNKIVWPHFEKLVGFFDKHLK